MRIIEEYDGRLPVYNVIDNNENLVKTFDSIEDAQAFIDNHKTTPCGEENPC